MQMHTLSSVAQKRANLAATVLFTKTIICTDKRDG